METEAGTHKRSTDDCEDDAEHVQGLGGNECHKLLPLRWPRIQAPPVDAPPCALGSHRRDQMPAGHAEGQERVPAGGVVRMPRVLFVCKQAAILLLPVRIKVQKKS